MPATIEQPRPLITPETHPRLWRFILWTMFPVSVLLHPSDTFKLVGLLRHNRRMGYRLRDTRRKLRALRRIDANCQADMSRAIHVHAIDCMLGYRLEPAMYVGLLTYAAELTEPKRGLDAYEVALAISVYARQIAAARPRPRNINVERTR